MASSDKLMYFMIKEKPAHPDGHIKPGCVCYFKENQYIPKYLSKENKIPVLCVGNIVENNIHADILAPLTQREAELMLALRNDEDRLVAERNREALAAAGDLREGSIVIVEKDGDWLQGVVRYVGSLENPTRMNPIHGVYFGIELQGNDRGKGENDGTLDYKTYYTCQDRCGIFAPFTRVKQANPKSPAPSGSAQPFLLNLPFEPLAVGARVSFFKDDDNCRYGMVIGLEEKDGQTIVQISTDKDDDGKTGGQVSVPLDCVIKEELLPQYDNEKTEVFISQEKMNASLAGFALNSEVTVVLAKKSARGWVRWIGTIPEKSGKKVGVELVEKWGLSDGTLRGKRYFTCPPGHGLFVQPSACSPFFPTRGDIEDGIAPENGYTDVQENVPPVKSEQVEKILIGQMKGVQGHCNSCYMDSALFSLFSCSSVLDSLLFKNTLLRDRPIQDTLLKDIVNPLRSRGFVPDHSVMKLRKQLQERGHSHTYTTDEKDPEEFLTLLMQQILTLDPPLKLSSGNAGVEPCYFYQIILDYGHNLVVPTVQQLLEHSLYINGLKLAEVPSCLILTMPRSGKKFKMFQKIIPSVELDINDLLRDVPQQCVFCAELALKECAECGTDPVFSTSGFKHFCELCSSQVHKHPRRRTHKPSPLCLPEGFPPRLGTGRLPRAPPREKLQLFAVLCIDTSHYVSFVKHGAEDTDWIFFDSMADRKGEIDGFNIPEVRACPEVGRYLNMTLAELANEVPRDMDGVAKRLFCDGYMYLYQSQSMAIYR